MKIYIRKEENIMKNAKKIVALLLCAVLLIGASVAGTVAYLTDTKAVENTFTVGKVKIKLDEATVDTESGKAVTPASRTEEGNKRIRMIPGRTIDKDPTVTVLKDSEDCYVRVKVTVDLPNWTADAAKAAEWMTDEQNFADAFRDWAGNFAGNYLRTDIMVGFNTENWELVKTNINSDNKTITYYINYRDNNSFNIVPKNTIDTKLPAVFDKVVAPRTLTKDQLALLEGMEIKVEAHAIQAEGFEDNGRPAEVNAWMAFGD